MRYVINEKGLIDLNPLEGLEEAGAPKELLEQLRKLQEVMGEYRIFGVQCPPELESAFEKLRYLDPRTDISDVLERFCSVAWLC